MQPYIDRKNLQKKVITSGKTLKFFADIKGEPPPKVTWTLQGNALNNDRYFTLCNNNIFYKITIINFNSSYHLILVNLYKPLLNLLVEQKMDYNKTLTDKYK